MFVDIIIFILYLQNRINNRFISEYLATNNVDYIIMQFRIIIFGFRLNALSCHHDVHDNRMQIELFSQSSDVLTDHQYQCHSRT